MPGHSRPRYQKHHTFLASTANTASGLINPPKHSGRPDFSKILPKAMDKLVADGLFEPDGLDENGMPMYKITKLGLATLKAMG